MLLGVYYWIREHPKITCHCPDYQSQGSPVRAPHFEPNRDAAKRLKGDMLGEGAVGKNDFMLIKVGLVCIIKMQIY